MADLTDRWAPCSCLQRGLSPVSPPHYNSKDSFSISYPVPVDDRPQLSNGKIRYIFVLRCLKNTQQITVFKELQLFCTENNWRIPFNWVISEISPQQDALWLLRSLKKEQHTCILFSLSEHFLSSRSLNILNYNWQSPRSSDHNINQWKHRFPFLLQFSDLHLQHRKVLRSPSMPQPALSHPTARQIWNI